MKLTLTLVDKKPEPSSGSQYAYSTNAKFVDYDRVSIIDAAMSSAVLAGVLRAIADDLDPIVACRDEVSA